MIRDNVHRIFEEIDSVSRKVGRGPKDITLVAVTKYSPLAAVEEAIAAGVTHIAENRVQDAAEKYRSLSPDRTKVTKHMIGHLQTNKVKTVLEIFDVIQSVDSLKLAQTIDKHAAAVNKVFDIFLEVNTSGEEQKYGVPLAEALALVDQILPLSCVRIQGLMTMAPLTEDQQWVRSTFRKLRELREQINQKYKGNPKIEMKYLSMGMSSDYKIAIEEGSNMVRIGSAIFRKE